VLPHLCSIPPNRFQLANTDRRYEFTDTITKAFFAQQIGRTIPFQFSEATPGLAELGFEPGAGDLEFTDYILLRAP
jgi:hypothetical protein